MMPAFPVKAKTFNSSKEIIFVNPSKKKKRILFLHTYTHIHTTFKINARKAY